LPLKLGYDMVSVRTGVHLACAPTFNQEQCLIRVETGE
jgi:hypothetical protein